VVRGYRKEAVAVPGIKTVDNDRFAETGEVYSLAQARQALGGETVVAYGDVLFRRYILDGLMSSEGDIALAVDGLSLATKDPKTAIRDLVAADRPYSGSYLDDAPVRLRAMSGSVPAGEVSGEWIGLARFSAKGADWLRQEIDLVEEEGLLDTADLPLLLSRLAAKHKVMVQYFAGHWLDVDTLSDLADARNFT